ncbi:MAG TPA: serine hydrolase [Longimicrobiales bacterium]|nr:serine hydrolase [Longimicrobiales bacterium]
MMARSRAALVWIVLASGACSSAGPGDATARRPVESVSPPRGATDTVGWYRAAPGQLVLVARGPGGGFRLLDFEGAEFATLPPADGGGLIWRVDGTERSVRFRAESDGAISGMRWTSGADSAFLPRAASGPFTLREVEFDSDGVRLAGTLLTPVEAAPGAPGAVVIHGSGASDRDNVWAYHIAQHLARSGVLVLLPDKRGSGASGGDWRAVDFPALARDALAGAELVRAQRGASARACIGLVGLSQGGWIAPLAARLDPRIAFAVDVSGAAVSVREQLEHEIRQDLRAAGFAKPDIERALALFSVADQHAAHPSHSAWNVYESMRARLLADTLAPFASALPADRDAWWWGWWRGVREFDPLPHWSALDVPVFVAYGSEDEHDNVPVAESVRRLRVALAGRDETIRVLEGSGHAIGDRTTGWIRRDFLGELGAWVRSACDGGRTSVESPRSPAAEHPVRDYLAAYNSGDPHRLTRVLGRIYAPDFLAGFGGADAAAWNRLELLRTYGPLGIEHVDTTASPPIVWTRGTISRGWVGHQLYLDEAAESRVTRHTIWRVRTSAPTPRSLSPRQLADSMAAYLDELARAGLFCGAVTLSRHGETLLAHAWGSDAQPSPAPVTRSTRFHIASVTKLFTVTALLQLVEHGVVSLHDSIGRWIPEYPQPYRDAVIVRHLLTHTSGIELDDDPDYLDAVRRAADADDLLAAQLRYIEGREPRFEPGSEYDYTSEGIDLAAIIIERATGRSWTDVVQERVLDPAGLRDTRFAVPRGEGDWAVGFTSLEHDLESVTPGVLRPSIDILPAVAKPSSGLWSTADDLHRFMRALLAGELLTSAWSDSLLTPAVEAGELPKYGMRTWAGLGAQGEDLWGVRTVGHGGVVPGYSAVIEYFPEDDWLLTVVSNTGEATGYLVFQRMLELVGTER